MRILKYGSRGADVTRLQKSLNLYPDGIFGKLTVEAVKDFQQKHGLVVDGIVGDATWSALGITSAAVPAQVQNKRRIDEIIVHCSATPEGKDFTVANIRSWHLQRGFSDIGYHYVIYRDGSVHKGRSESITGAHCTGHNSRSIGVCYIGGLAADGKTPKDTRTPAQKESLLKLLLELVAKYPNAKIHGHRDFANKACPSFDATKEFSSI